MLESRSVDTYCGQETRFRGSSVEMNDGEAAQCKLIWIENEKGLGGVGTFFTEKWVNKVIDIGRVSDRMVIIKVLILWTIISVTSFYAPQCGLDDNQKDDFYDSFINIFRMLGEKDILVTARDSNGHVGHNAEDFEDLHGSFY